VLEPLDFVARLAALVPPPRAHLTRFHGVFAVHAAGRAAITPAGRGTGVKRRAAVVEAPPSRDVRMNWARRLKRVFGIEIEQYQQAGIADTVHIDFIKSHYYRSRPTVNPSRIVPIGPEIDYWEPHRWEKIGV
jgi:hypothetical protein